MLYKNGKWIDFDSKDAELKKDIDHYTKKISEYRQTYGKHIIIKNIKYLDGPKINPTGIAEAIPNEGLPAETYTKGGKGGQEYWVYSEEPLSSKDGELTLKNRHIMVYDGEITIDIDDKPDLAYFIIEKHNFYGKSYIVHDPRSIAKKKADNKRLRLRLDKAIFDDASPLNSNIQQLRTVASRWGIVNVQTKTPDELQTELYELVSSNQERIDKIHDPKARAGIRGVDAFLEDAEMNIDTVLGAKVMRAIEEGIVQFNHAHNSWIIPDPEGGKGVTLCNVPVNELGTKTEVLISEVASDAVVKRDLENALGEESAAMEKPCELEDIQKTTSITFMNRIAKQLGVSKETSRMKMEERREVLEDKWKELYAE